MAGVRSSSSPPSSGCPTSARTCSTHGKAASIVAAVWRTPGRISIAHARVGGNARLSDAKAALAIASVGASSLIEARRFPSSEANAPIVRLKLTIRSSSADSLRTRPADVRAAPSISRARSRSGSVPSSAWLTWACARAAGPAYS